MQFVLTNTDRFYSAAEILRIDLLRQFAEERLSDDVYYFNRYTEVVEAVLD